MESVSGKVNLQTFRTLNMTMHWPEVNHIVASCKLQQFPVKHVHFGLMAKSETEIPAEDRLDSPSEKLSVATPLWLF